MAWTMSRQTRRILLELAIADLVALVRPTVDRNRRGDGSASPAFEALATALDRFDRLGGSEALTLELTREGKDDAAAHSGAIRSASASRLRRRHGGGRAVPARSGAVRTAGSDSVGAATP